VAAALAIALIMALAAYYRQAERGRISRYFIGRFAIAAGMRMSYRAIG